MRIRKNGLGDSPIVFPADSHFNPGQEVQTRYCQLNQSPWDVMTLTDFSPPDSPMAPLRHSNPFEVEEEHASAVFNDPIPKPSVDPEEKKTTNEYCNNDITIEEVEEERALAVFNDPIPKPSVDPKKKTTDECCNNDLTIEEDKEEHAFDLNKDPIPPKPFVDPEEQTTDEYYNYDLTIEEVDQKLPKLPPMEENVQIPKPPPPTAADDAKKNDTVIFKSTEMAMRDLLRGWIKDREDEAAAAAAASSSPSPDLLGRFGGFGQRSGRKRKAYEMSDAGSSKPANP